MFAASLPGTGTADCRDPALRGKVTDVSETGSQARVRPRRSTSALGDLLPPRELVLHLLFAAGFIVAVIISRSAVYSGSLVSVAWPPVGIAVWWAVTCRSRASLAAVCAVAFAVSALHIWFVEGFSPVIAGMLGAAQVLAGPVVAPVMTLLTERGPRSVAGLAELRPAPIARITQPHHVYRLLLASLIVLPAAKAVTLLAIATQGGDPSLTVYVGLILRDLAGIIAIAGPGIALSSAAIRGLGRAALIELAILIVGTALLLLLIFGRGQDLPTAYIALLPLYLSATRLPVAAAVVHAVFTAVTATVLTFGLGAGPFAASGDSPIEQATAVQLFIITCMLLSLVVSTTVQQHSTLLAEYQAVADTIPDALLVVDQDGRAVPLNVAAEQVVTRRADGTYVLRAAREVHGPLLDESTAPARRALRGEAVRGFQIELDDGLDGPAMQERIYTVSATSLQRPGRTEPSNALLVYHDSTEEHRTMHRLQQAHDEARQLFENAPHGVAVLAEDGRILQANHALEELLGIRASQLQGRRLDDFSSDGDLQREVEAALALPGERVHADRCLSTPDGGSRRLALSFRATAAEHREAASLLVNAVDVTERQRLHEMVSHLADHDPLTGLVNRRRFELELMRVREKASGESSDAALLLIDLDYFKTVNDRHGHHTGDDLLIEFAQLLSTCVRSFDIVGRLGGDEFVILLPDADRQSAEGVGARVVERVERTFRGRPGELGRVTASIGIAMLSEAEGEGVDPLQLADQMMYDAKRAGGNRIAGFAPGRTAERGTRAELSRSGVEQLLADGALRLELQPISELATGRIMLAEGLLRTVDQAEHNSAQLVAAAERAGLAPMLDAHVARQGIPLLPRLRTARPGFRLALNLSAQSLGSQEVLGAVIEQIREHRIEPGSLVLEITETAPVEDYAAARAFQAALREHGVEFALDDFGAGHDPYRRLLELDFSLVKIAGDLVRGMADEGAPRSIVHSIVQLATARGMETVAEHISDAQLLDAARRSGATYAQGFHLGASLPPQTFLTAHLGET